MDARMKAVLSSCILRCLLGRRSTRPKRNDIKEQQRLPKPAPMTERRRRGASVFDFYNISYNAGYTKYREAKKPSFSGFRPFRRFLSLLGWLGRFSRFVQQLCYLNALLCMFLSAFLFYNRLVARKTFSNSNVQFFAARFGCGILTTSVSLPAQTKLLL